MRATLATALLCACWSGVPVREVEFIYVRSSPGETSVCRGLDALQRNHPIPTVRSLDCGSSTDTVDDFYYCLYNQYFFFTMDLEYWVQEAIYRCEDKEVPWSE